jgi:cyclophilin family peptidyl-prolyl cis-trans isomerase
MTCSSCTPELRRLSLATLPTLLVAGARGAAALSIVIVTATIALPHHASAQIRPAPLTHADSVLLYAALRAEDRRDATAPALAEAEAHPDARIAHIARRARARLGDSTFAARPTLGRPDSTRLLPTWPEPEWADRYRALGGRDGACAQLLAAFDDSAVHVRHRAIALSGQRRSCLGSDSLRTRLEALVRSESDSERGGNSSGEALVALTRVDEAAARPLRQALVTHPNPAHRRAAARSATIAADTAVLRRLADDADANVQEAAIHGLAATVGLADAALYRARIAAEAPQVALAAAVALKDSDDAATQDAVRNELTRRHARNWASERDIRTALRAVLGEPPTEPWQPGHADSLPWEVVALALGERRFIAVTMSPRSGGGAFTVELRGDVAPIQAARVLAHARRAGYDGTRWHRVEPNFVIQGGSPYDNEYSGSARFVVDELGTIPHPRGTVGMSTRGHSTGDLQWFVNLRDNARLMGAYTVFGVVVEGMPRVDDVVEGDVIATMREVSAPRRGQP